MWVVFFDRLCDRKRADRTEHTPIGSLCEQTDEVFILSSSHIGRVGYPLAVWLVLAVLAILNGGFRETVLVSMAQPATAHLLSTALLVSIILLVAFVYFNWTSIEYSRRELLGIGVGWTVLTVGFEFFIGYVEGVPPAEMISQYDVLAGEVWIIVPLTLLVSPLVFGWYLQR